MKTVLITGGTGFLGSNITNHLRQRYNVISVGSEYDLRDPSNAIKLLEQYQPNVVVHAAGSVGGILANKENPAKFMYDNLSMGMNMIEKSRLFRISKFIMLGTVCSYPKFTAVPFNENDLWLGYPEETNAPYGIAKKTLMKMVETYHEQYGFNGVNLIPVNMYGPYDHFNLTTSHVIPALILKFHKAITDNEKSVTIWGSGNVSREFLYAEDCAEAIELAIESDVGPEPMNIGNGTEIQISELAKEIANQMGFDGDLVFDQTKPDGQPRRCLDTSKAKDKLGFVAKTSLQTGLNKTIQWFLKGVN